MPVVTQEVFFNLFNSTDEFESKFTFHSVEEFPPPDEFKPSQKTYPSQEAKGKQESSSPAWSLRRTKLSSLLEILSGT